MTFRLKWFVGALLLLPSIGTAEIEGRVTGCATRHFPA